MFAFLAFAVLLGSASAFLAPSTRASKSAMSMIGDKSKALPFDERPAALDGTLAGDNGFDPAGFTLLGEAYGVNVDSQKWFREAEIVHSRVAMLAIVGLLFPAWYHFPGNDYFGEDVYAEMNPYKALSTVPAGAFLQIGAAAGVVELWRIKRVINGDKEPGDLGLGQKGIWNPFNFQYTEEEYFEKEVQEIKHGRLAMFAALGGLLQVKNTGMGLGTQVQELLSLPDARDVLVGPGTLNDFFPPNI